MSDLTFDLPQDEILGIIGPNGAGKTILTSLISGTLVPSTGDIRFQANRCAASQRIGGRVLALAAHSRS